METGENILNCGAHHCLTSVCVGWMLGVCRKEEMFRDYSNKTHQTQRVNHIAHKTRRHMGGDGRSENLENTCGSILLSHHLQLVVLVVEWSYTIDLVGFVWDYLSSRCSFLSRSSSSTYCSCFFFCWCNSPGLLYSMQFVFYLQFFHSLL